MQTVRGVDPRELNALADDAANQALDSNNDWKHAHEECIQHAKEKAANLRICFDGAHRRSGKSAAGVTIIAYHEDGQRDLLVRAGRLLGTLDSSFLAELLSMEWALEILWSDIL